MMGRVMSFRFDKDPDGQRLGREMVEVFREKSEWPPLDEFERERDEVEPSDNQNFDRNEEDEDA